MPKEGLGLCCFTLKLLLCREKKAICCKVTFQNYFYSPIFKFNPGAEFLLAAWVSPCGIFGIPWGDPAEHYPGAHWHSVCVLSLAPAWGLCWDPAVVPLSPGFPGSLQKAQAGG